MATYEFNTYITIDAEDYESAISWFDYKTKGLNTYVADIEEK
jgi:hypothetical protein